MQSMEHLYQVVSDRREHPQEKSYTCYLFEQGLDKICKKIGEESAEVIIAAKNGVPCVILRAMSDNADEDGHEVLVVKKFSISEYVATATKIVAAMVEKL